jgi:bifunctional DNase/RNase
VQIDARPSDSIAIALRFAAPIFATETLLSNMTIETAGEPEDNEPTVQGGSPELDAEQLKSYLEQLRPEDFGKFNP